MCPCRMGYVALLARSPMRLRLIFDLVFLGFLFGVLPALRVGRQYSASLSFAVFCDPHAWPVRLFTHFCLPQSRRLFPAADLRTCPCFFRHLAVACMCGLAATRAEKSRGGRNLRSPCRPFSVLSHHLAVTCIVRHGLSFMLPSALPYSVP